MITNLVNGKRYIGQSWDIETRWRDERKAKPGIINSHLCRAFKKYGVDNFEFRVLAEADNQQRLDDLEMAYIDILETTDSAKGYNKKSGGSRGKHSEESKRKMSENKKGKPGIPRSDQTRAKIAAAFKGRPSPMKGKTSPHDEEHRRKISEANKGKPAWNKGRAQSEETIRKRVETRRRNKEKMNEDRA